MDFFGVAQEAIANNDFSSARDAITEERKARTMEMRQRSRIKVTSEPPAWRKKGKSVDTDALTGRARKHLSTIAKDRESIEEMLQSVAEAGETAEQQIEETFGALLEVLQERKEELLARAASVRTSKQAKLTAQSDALQEAEDALGPACDELEGAQGAQERASATRAVQRQIREYVQLREEKFKGISGSSCRYLDV